MVDKLLNSLNISRDCIGLDFLSDDQKKFDIAAVCHEVRSLDLAQNEQICATFAVVGHRVAGNIESFPLGSICHLRSCLFDAVIIVKVWACFQADTPERPLGETRIPLPHLATKCDGSLYHTWVNLECAGLNDSVASTGMLPAETTEAFAQAMSSGPRQLFQPKVCLSLCRSADLSPDGQILWTASVPRKTKIDCWGPLLRSQQQHELMCRAQYLQGGQLRTNGQDGPVRLVHLKAQADEQKREIEALQEQLQSSAVNGSPSHGSTVPTSAEALDALLSGEKWKEKPSMNSLEETAHRQIAEAMSLAENVEAGAARRGRGAEVAKELEHQRNLQRQLQQELEGNQVDLSKIGDEANNKIEAANVRIRALRREREEAQRAGEERKAANQNLQKMIEVVEHEKSQLRDQKEALIRIVEDLHTSVTKAGLPAGNGMDRASIDSLGGFKLPG